MSTDIGRIRISFSIMDITMPIDGAKNMSKQSKKRSYIQIILILLISFSLSSAHANQLPPVTGATYNGEQITWNNMPGARGYNIHLEFQYIDTVIGATTYKPTQLGEYRIVAFDNNGQLSPLQVIDIGVVPTTNIAEVNSLPSGEIIVTPPIEHDEQLPPVTGAIYNDGVITWDELAGASGYNLYLNAAYIDTVRDVSSYTPVEPGEYRIVAFDDEGRYSPLFVIEANVVPTTNFALVNLDDETTNDNPTTPQNVELLVYSNTAAELFWDRPSIDENIIHTEVSRDDVLLGTSAGTSFFDTTRTDRSIVYRYQLVAVNANGERSAPAIVNPGALDGDPNEDVLALMSGISDVASNNPHVRWFSTLRSLIAAENPLILLSTENVRNDDNIFVVRNTYLCDTDAPGTLTIDEIPSRFGIFVLDFDGCTVDRTSYDGGLSIVRTDIGGYNANYTDLEIADEHITYINGQVSLSIGRAINFMTLTYTDFEYYVIGNLDDEEGIDTDVVLNQVITDATIGDVRNTFTTNFTVSAPWTRGDVVEVTTTEQFMDANLGEGNYLTGQLTVLSTTGDRVLVNADTGDALTWSANVITEDNEVSISRSWAESGKLPCLSVTQGNDAVVGCTVR